MERPPFDELSNDEWLEWYRMTPQERWAESCRLWEFYLSVGGSLDAETDSQSPFDADREPSLPPAYGGGGAKIIRRGPVLAKLDKKVNRYEHRIRN